MKGWRVTAVVLLAAAVLAAGVAPASGHDRSHAPAAPAAGPQAGLIPPALDPATGLAAPVGSLALALVVTVGLLRRRPRHTLALVVALTLTVFSLQAGVHSVHHLGAGDGGQCPIATAAAQTAGTVALPVDVLPAPVLLARCGASLEDADPAWHALGAERDRAPPRLA
jgi:hypothetical protein